MENCGINLSPTLNKNQDLVLWIGEQQNIEIFGGHFSNNLVIGGYVGKLQDSNSC